MAVERTLSIIKPDATRRNLTGKIIAKFEDAGLRVIASRRTRLSKAQAEAFYGVHRERPFFFLNGCRLSARLLGLFRGCPIRSQFLQRNLCKAIGQKRVHGVDRVIAVLSEHFLWEILIENCSYRAAYGGALTHDLKRRLTDRLIPKNTSRFAQKRRDRTGGVYTKFAPGGGEKVSGQGDLRG